jgi:hypothetical protein
LSETKWRSNHQRLKQFEVEDASFEEQLSGLCSAGATIAELASGLQAWVPSEEVRHALGRETEARVGC